MHSNMCVVAVRSSVFVDEAVTIIQLYCSESCERDITRTDEDFSCVVTVVVAPISGNVTVRRYGN